MSSFSNQAIDCRGELKSKMNWIGWRHPPLGWVKPNVDGSTLKESGTMGAGGTIEDATRRWITGFTAQLEDYSIAVAKTWALLHYLKMGWDSSVRKYIIEMDSLTVLNWIKGVEEVFCSHANLVPECQELLKRSSLVPLQFVYR